MLVRLVALVTERPRTVLLVAVMLALVGAWLGVTRLSIDGDTDSLIARDRPFLAGYRAFQEEFGDLEGVIIAVDPRGDDAAAQRAVDRLAQSLARLAKEQLVTRVAAFIEPLEQPRLASWSLSDDALAVLAEAAPILGDAARDQAAACDTLNSFLTIEPHRTYLRAPEGTLLLVEAVPAKDFTALEPFARSIAAIRAECAAVQTEFPMVKFGLTGKPVLQADEMATANADMTRASLASLAIITVLFIVVFRGVRRPLLAVVAFAIATGWTYGAATLLVGRLTVLSTVFLLVLVGAGLDYGVHVVSRYAEFRAMLPRRAAVVDALRSVGPSTLVGALGSASVFFLALSSDFGGLRELGVIAGTGLLLCALAMVTVLPALLLVAGDSAPDSTPTQTVAHAAARPRSRRWFATALSVALPILAALAALPWAPAFQSNLLELQSPTLESVRWERRLLDESPGSSWYAVSVVRSVEEAARLEALAAGQSSIARTESVASLVRIETPMRVALRTEIAQAIAGPLPPLNSTASIASHSARAIIDGARGSLRDALPPALRDRWSSAQGGYLVHYYPSGDAWEEKPLRAFVQAVRSVDANATGVPITQLESIDDMRNAFTRLSWLSLVAVACIAWLDFRSVRLTMLATGSVVAGVAMTLGVLALLRVELNLANFFAIPMLLGLSIDSGIHILHRASDGAEALRSTVRTVAFTALTTAIGFGALIFAEHRGLHTLGVVMAVGSLCCLYVSCVFLPALLARQASAPTNSGSTPSGSAARKFFP